MFGIGIQELIFIIVIAFIVLGPEKLIHLSYYIGKENREIKDIFGDIRSSFYREIEIIKEEMDKD